MNHNKYNLVVQLLRLFLDTVCISSAIVLAYGLKFKLNWFFKLFQLEWGSIYQHAQIEPYLQVMGIIVCLWIISFYFVGMYRPVQGIVPEVDEFMRVVKGVTLGTVQVIVISFIYKSIPDSRYVALYSWGIGVLLIFACRLLVLRLETKLCQKGIGVQNVLVIGGGVFGQDIAEKIVQFPTLHLRYKGTLDDAPPAKIHYHLQNKFKFLGGIQSYPEICEQENIDSIFLTRRDVSQVYIFNLIHFAETHNIDLKIVSEMMLVAPLSSSEIMDGVPMLSSAKSPHIGGLFFKRLFDILGALLLLLVLSPVFCIIALLIKLSSKGPVLYKQKRVGLLGKVFDMYKFRSMRVDAEKHTGPVMVDTQAETRYTPIGKTLRQYSLDELPQLWNVLKGEMSIVGPRPERPHFVSQFSKEIPYYHFRHKMKGGITGWAQVNGRSVLTNRPEHKVRYDMYYIKSWSLIFDLKILLKTIWVVFQREESY